MEALLHKGREALRNNKSKGSDGPAPWEREIILRADDMALQFVILNELETDDMTDILWQTYEHRWLDGVSANGKPFKAHIPCGDPDACLVKDEDGKHLTKGLSYRWLTNVLVLGLTYKGKEIEVGLKNKEVVTAEKPWSKRDVADRVFYINQGGDTNDALLFQEEKDGRLMPKKGKKDKKAAYVAREYTLRRFRGPNRVEYSLHAGDKLYFREDGIFTADDFEDEDGKPTPSLGAVNGLELIEQALEARHNLGEIVHEAVDDGLIGCGFKERKATSGGNGRPAANAAKSGNSEPETTDDDDDDDLADFDEVDLDTLDDDGDDSGELV